MLMNTEYIELFRQRKWLDAFDSLPLNLPKVVDVAPEDYVVIRVRASDFNKANETKRISVSIDYKANTVIVTATKKQNGTSA